MRSRAFVEAYIRKRTTKAGSVSTTLVESYRDEMGRPRQRILANLHGELDTLRAMAELAAKHDVLLQLREEEHAEPSNRGAGFVLVTERALTEHNHRIAQIDRQLAAIERDLAGINTHCSASDGRIPAGRPTLQARILPGFRAGLGSCYGAQASRRRATANGQGKHMVKIQPPQSLVEGASPVQPGKSGNTTP